MVRAALVAVTFASAAALAACGSNGSSSVASTTPSLLPSMSSGSTTSAGGSSTSTARTAEEPLHTGCVPPTADVQYASGVATVQVSAGPGKGRLDLAVQPRGRSEYRASSRDLKGEWKDAAGKLLFVNLSGGDPCKPSPSAFVRIEAEGSSGPAFADSARNRCKVELKAFSAQGVDGSFTCTQLGGGGAGVFIDATGTFSLRV